MSGETVPVDRLVAFVYGAGVHPSLRAGLVAAADLVADRQGPWVFTDEDLAATARAIVERLATPAGPDDVAASVIASLDAARRGLFDLWSNHRGSIPTHLLHHVEQLEGRLTGFLSEHTDQVLAITAPAPTPAAAADPVPAAAVDVEAPESGRVPFPSLDGALKFSSADWQAMIRSRDLSVPDVKAELARRITAGGKVPPARLSDLKGNRYSTGIMLRVVSDLDVAAHPTPEAGA